MADKIHTPAFGQSTNFGPPPGFEKVAKIGTGYSAGTGGLAGVVGAPFPITLNNQTVPISQTDVVFDSYKAQGRLRIISILHVCTATAATATFKVRNTTASVDILGDTTPVVAAAYADPASATVAIVEKDELIKLQCTTNGTGTITNLHVELLAQYIGAPDNQ